MADATILDLTEENNPDLTTAYVEIVDNSDPLTPVSRRINLRDLRGDGWAYYVDTANTVGSPLVVNSARVQIPIDGLGATTEKSFLPKGVTDFWDTTLNKIIPENVGDCFIARLDFTAVPTGADVYFEIELDIGTGTPIKILTDVELFPKGSGVAQPFSLALPHFALATFIANGGEIYMDTTTGANNVSVYDTAIHIQRTFAAN